MLVATTLPLRSWTWTSRSDTRALAPMVTSRRPVASAVTLKKSSSALRWIVSPGSLYEACAPRSVATPAARASFGSNRSGKAPVMENTSKRICWPVAVAPLKVLPVNAAYAMPSVAASPLYSPMRRVGGLSGGLPKFGAPTSVSKPMSLTRTSFRKVNAPSLLNVANVSSRKLPLALV